MTRRQSIFSTITGAVSGLFVAKAATAEVPTIGAPVSDEVRFGLFVAKAASAPVMVELRGNDQVFPVDIARLPVTDIEAPEAPPFLGRNHGAALGLQPIDEVRLAEAKDVLRKIGFVTRSITITRTSGDYAHIVIDLGQASDPRVPRA